MTILEYESGHRPVRHVPAGPCRHGALLFVLKSLREDLGGQAMIYITAVVAAFLLVYLFTALVRPEWF